MKDTRITSADLLMEIEECHAMACFLADAIGLILEENSNYTKKCPVPHGAESCLGLLADKLKQLSMRI
jgi:hypothetical protein